MDLLIKRVDQLADLACKLAARVKELETKVAVLEKSTPPHLARIERRSS
jgi:hypothetical protein